MRRRIRHAAGVLSAVLGVCAAQIVAAQTEAPLGYYRFPAVSGRTVVFTAEGDLWRVPLEGGIAQRLTSHLNEESRAAISPDGKWIAFSAAYEGPTEVYVMPLDGGLPRRLTWDGLNAQVRGWTPDAKILYATRSQADLPVTQLLTVDPVSARREPIPLAQAAQGVYAGPQFIFTRFDAHGSHTKRYRGGMLQQLWVWDGGTTEARPLLPGDEAASRSPMVWNGRIYFVGDRDLHMNLWSVRLDGKDPVQHTFHRGWDVLGTSLSEGRIVYQLGADLRVFDIATTTDTAIPIRLASDLDQERERWVKKPMDYTSTLHLSPDGDRVVATTRGQVFVLPAQRGRIVDASRQPGVRYRQARFMPDGKSILAMSDASGEIEFWKLPANGIGTPAQITRNGTVMRWDGTPSPDGHYIASADKNQVLSLIDAATGESHQIDVCDTWSDFQDLTWSRDGRWLAYAKAAGNGLLQVWVYDTKSRTRTPATDDRTDSWSPTWSPDGHWLWFLSDRHFESTVTSIWGSRQPDPFFDQRTKLYGVALQSKFRSPFDPVDELHPADDKGADDKADTAKKDSDTKAKKAKSKSKAASKDTAKDKTSAGLDPVEIALEGLAARLIEVPVPPGNYSALGTDGKRLYFLAASTEPDPKFALRALAIDREGDEPTTVMEDVASYEVSGDGKKLLVRKKDNLYVFEGAGKAPGELDKAQVPLGDWTFRFDPRIEWRQMFTEAWRLERDYFYDPALHGVDWNAVRDRYQPIADRVKDRAELADVFQQMIGELSALHMYVNGGDARRAPDPADPGALGATLVRDEPAGGWRIARIPATDANWPDEASPLARPGVDVREGDVIQMVDGAATLPVPDIGALLRNKTGKPVLLRIGRGGVTHDVLIKPLTPGEATALRYRAWEYDRRVRVEKQGAGRIGYVHLQAMGAGDIARWTRDYYPVFEREGLIIDVRNNNGGNVDSWILGKLLRRNWFYWQPRVGRPFGNMPYAFRGRMCVLVNERTVSDGEIFAEGFRRLGLGKVVGTRSLGGEIWLSASNFLVDRGIATAAETGVFGLESAWIIEQHGVDPDVVVDNLPRATFGGSDAQLDAAVRLLLDDLQKNPVPKVETPRYPVKAVR